MTTLTIKPEVSLGIKPAPLDAVTHPEWTAECRKALAPFVEAPAMLEALKCCLDVLIAGASATDESRRQAMWNASYVIEKVKGRA